jgi:uncharacterized membrane protein
VTRTAQQAELRAVRVPSHQFVELRVLFPRSVLSSTAGTQVRHEEALDRIIAEEREDAASYERDQEKIRNALDHLPLTILVLLAAALLPGLAIVAAAYWFFGRERRTGYEREYEQEQPTELEPALVPPLLRQSPAVGSFEFTATLFDLVRRGRYKAVPVTTERSVWGGLRQEDVADLELSPGGDVELARHERPVAHVIDAVLETGPERLSLFRDRITAERETNSKRFKAFKTALADTIRERRWFLAAGLPLLVAAGVPLAAVGAILLWIGIERFEAFAPRWGDILLIVFGVCALVNAAVIAVGLYKVRVWRRRTPAAQQEAERWEAFRRYLTDFPRLDIAPPASLELWERLLVYGIAFGTARKVRANRPFRLCARETQAPV